MKVYKVTDKTQFPGSNYPYLVVYFNTKSIDKSVITYIYDYYKNLFKKNAKRGYMMPHHSPIPVGYKELNRIEIVKLMLIKGSSNWWDKDFV
jgi:hypothetical protein